MEAYIADWLQLLLRWIHMITGIAWIGASFYFVWLDNHLQTAPQWKQDKGIGGDLWAIHGGGVYEIGKYTMGPEKMPETLHWFKWEAYSTWISGMLLLVAVYYLGADAYLIDRRVASLSAAEAITIGLSFIIVGWFVYNALCNSPIAKNSVLLSGLLLLILVGSSYALSHLFSGRGAYIHIGAMIGTMMVGNVFAVIMPSQKALVDAITNNSSVDPAWGIKAKLRSTHNTYLTLPLLFIMISNHYPMTYSHEYNWLILLVITAITASARHFFILRHKGIVKPILLIGPALATIVLAALIAPAPIPKTPAAQSASPPTAEQLHLIVKKRCASCHSESPTDDVFTIAPAGVLLDTQEQMLQWAPRIIARSVQTHDMPFMNKTNMTDEERALLGQGFGNL